MLEGQTAIVTGASSGIGRHFAKTLAGDGAQVAVLARRTERLKSLVKEIEADGGAAVAIELDVSNAESFSAAVDRIQETFGRRARILINNAGTGITRKSTKLAIEEADRMWAVNVRAPYFMSREVARRLIDAGEPGRIVNIASIGAFFHDGRVPSAFYSTTKAAVVRMTETLAVEWAEFNINVNAIAPGFIRSEMSEPYIERRGADIAAGFRRGRFGEPSHLDSSLRYLVAPDSEFVTGICMKVDDAQMPR